MIYERTVFGSCVFFARQVVEIDEVGDDSLGGGPAAGAFALEQGLGAIFVGDFDGVAFAAGLGEGVAGRDGLGGDGDLDTLGGLEEGCDLAECRARFELEGGDIGGEGDAADGDGFGVPGFAGEDSEFVFGIAAVEVAGGVGFSQAAELGFGDGVGEGGAFGGLVEDEVRAVRPRSATGPACR